jgi:hypothetical protein
MVASLRVLVESIARDLIDARFAADVAASELAERYREHPTLRAMNIPSLNITNVQVELAFLLEDVPEDTEGEAEVPSEERMKEASDNLIREVLRVPSVAERTANANLRNALVGTLSERLPTLMTPREGVPTSHRLAAIEETITEALRARRIDQISSSEAEKLKSAISAIDARLIADARPTGLPRIIVNAESLHRVDPTAINRISFSVDLDRKRWVEVEERDDRRTVLSDE